MTFSFCSSCAALYPPSSLQHSSLTCQTSAGYVISAIFVCAEYQRLGIHFRQHRVLRASFWMKLFFILIERLSSLFLGYEERRG